MKLTRHDPPEIRQRDVRMDQEQGKASPARRAVRNAIEGSKGYLPRGVVAPLVINYQHAFGRSFQGAYFSPALCSCH